MRLNSSRVSRTGGLCKSTSTAAAKRASQSRNACGVETPRGGRAITHGICADPASVTCGTGATIWPRSDPSTEPPTRKSGTSDPTSAANLQPRLPWQTQVELAFEPEQRRGRVGGPRAHAALDRQVLLDVHLNSGSDAGRRKRRSTIFHTVLRASVGTRGWLEVSAIAVSGATWRAPSPDRAGQLSGRGSKASESRPGAAGRSPGRD